MAFEPIEFCNPMKGCLLPGGNMPGIRGLKEGDSLSWDYGFYAEKAAELREMLEETQKGRNIETPK